MAKKKAKAKKAVKKSGLKKKDKGTILVLAGLFIGIGVGIAIGKAAVGTLAGLGIGLLASYFLENKK
jgi:hypothetical protein